MVDSTRVAVESAQGFVDSGFGLLILGTAIGILGWIARNLHANLVKLDDRIKSLEISTNDLANVKQSIAGIGVRTGNLESESLLHGSNYKQMDDLIKEMRTEFKETSQILADLYTKINLIHTDVAVMKERTSK